jgi:LuxR family transcriptional regulator, maltose regulon positive regulatory protein
LTEAFSTLLHTKLHRPRVSSDLILRARLLDQLDEGINRWLTLVCAPAGFGKTTLVSSWIMNLSSKSEPIPVAWLSLDRDDSEVVRFTQYFIAALRTMFAGACAETLQLLSGSQLVSLESVSATLSNDILQIPERFVLVLDDYQVIQGEAIPNLLTSLLQHWPQPLHLVLISRNNPPLPLPRLRANGLLTEIRSNDLRFDKAETAAFLNRQLKTLLTDHVIKVISERVEGWIGALRLATLSLHSATDVHHRIINMAGSEGNIADYLTDEVLDHQLPVIQTFLKKTSILDSFCSPLCEAVIGDLDPAWNVQACIVWLESEDLFIISMDDKKYWYRFHHLFLELLRQRARDEFGPEQIANLHRRAAVWYAQHGMPDQALHHSLESGDLDLLAQLLADHLRDMLNREDRPALERWLNLVPKEVIQKRPELLLFKAWVYQFSWQLDALGKEIQQVEALLAAHQGSPLSEGIRQTLQAQIAVLKAQLAYFNHQPEIAQSYCDEALVSAPESWPILRGGAMLFLGLSMLATGEGQGAERLLLDRYEALEDRTNGYALRLLQCLCFIYLTHADLDQLYQTARVMLLLAEAGGLVVMQGWAHYFQGIALYQWNDLEAAADHFNYLSNHPYTTQALTAREGITGRALIHHTRGESAEAWRMVDLLSQINLERMGAEAEQTRSLRARLKMMEGDLESALRWADGYLTLPSYEPIRWIETPGLTRARILIKRKQPGDFLKAHQVLDALADSAERSYNTLLKMEIMAMRALVFQAEDNSTDALAALQQAVDLARPGGFLRVFVDSGPEMLKLVSQLARRDHFAAYLQKIRNAFPDSDDSGESGEAIAESMRLSSDNLITTWVEPLTTREREVLIYLRKPTSIKEIAVDLSISYATIKRHTINIYGKLGVNSRWDAVTKAIELGLLSR